jgi:uncharacterized membrane protein
MATWEEHLKRWEDAGVVEATTAERIRAFEMEHEAPKESRWQVGVVLALGVILLVGGLMLSVSSHWDEVSPWQRLALVLGFLATLHALAAMSAERFPGMAMALHGVGTAGAGAAIYTVGEIFNMQEHWPTAVLIWALCAGAGWWLLRDQVQQSLTMLLVPVWVVCEWSFRAEGYAAGPIYAARMDAVIAVVLLTGLIRYRRRGVFWTLYLAGALNLIGSVVVMSEGWQSWVDEPTLPVKLKVACGVIIVAAMVCGWLWERRNLVPLAAVALMAYLLPWRPTEYVAGPPMDFGSTPYQRGEPGVLMYVLVAATCVVLAWWGLRTKSKAIVNYAVVAFGLSVLWFYFSNMMDKLGRSFGLMGLGILFLLGGWVLERVRRRLIVGLEGQAA